jgi:hypothetical protein
MISNRANESLGCYPFWHPHDQMMNSKSTRVPSITNIYLTELFLIEDFALTKAMLVESFSRKSKGFSRSTNRDTRALIGAKGIHTASEGKKDLANP